MQMKLQQSMQQQLQQQMSRLRLLLLLLLLLLLSSSSEHQLIEGSLQRPQQRLLKLLRPHQIRQQHQLWQYQ
jgi:membrane associated rhomboid family serine protease